MNGNIKDAVKGLTGLSQVKIQLNRESRFCFNCFVKSIVMSSVPKYVTTRGNCHFSYVDRFGLSTLFTFETADSTFSRKQSSES